MARHYSHIDGTLEETFDAMDEQLAIDVAFRMPLSKEKSEVVVNGHIFGSSRS